MYPTHPAFTCLFTGALSQQRILSAHLSAQRSLVFLLWLSSALQGTPVWTRWVLQFPFTSQLKTSLLNYWTTKLAASLNLTLMSHQVWCGALKQNILVDVLMMSLYIIRDVIKVRLISLYLLTFLSPTTNEMVTLSPVFSRFILPPLPHARIRHEWY